MNISHIATMTMKSKMKCQFQKEKLFRDSAKLEKAHNNIQTVNDAQKIKLTTQ